MANFLIWSYEACNNNDKWVFENLVLGPKYYWGQSGLGAKLGLSPCNWVQKILSYTDFTTIFKIQTLIFCRFHQPHDMRVYKTRFFSGSKNRISLEASK